MNKVTATGTEHDYLGREFYRAFAEGWRKNMTPKAIEFYFTDDLNNSSSNS
jgi:hypothetical protein